jgi:hypothetical protein
MDGMLPVLRLMGGAAMLARAVQIAIAVSLFCIVSATASAHNVWCHCGKNNRDATIKFFHKSGEVYEAVVDVMRTWHAGNGPLERGVIAEFEASSSGERKPFHFVETLYSLNSQFPSSMRRLTRYFQKPRGLRGSLPLEPATLMLLA